MDASDLESLIQYAAQVPALRWELGELSRENEELRALIPSGKPGPEPKYNHAALVDDYIDFRSGWKGFTDQPGKGLEPSEAVERVQEKHGFPTWFACRRALERCRAELETMPAEVEDPVGVLTYSRDCLSDLPTIQNR